MSLDPLLESLATEDPDEQAFLALESASLAESKLTIVLVATREGSPPARWELRCHGVRKHVIRLGGFDRLEVVHEHPVLWPFTEPHAEVSFYGKPASIDGLVGEIFKAHIRVADRRTPFRIEPEVLEGGFGVLAQGPLALMRAYHEVLARHPMKPALLTLGPPKRWDGARWMPEESELIALLMDDSYAIAESIDAQRAP